MNDRVSVDIQGGVADVRLVRQLSSARCVEGQTWGQDRSGLWVTQGCRAEFEVRGRGNGWGNGGNWGNNTSRRRCVVKALVLGLINK